MATDSAIQTDVPTQDEAGHVPTPHEVAQNERMRIMDLMGERREAEVRQEGETGIVSNDPVKNLDAIAEARAKPAAEPVAAPVAEPDAPANEGGAPASETKPATVRVKVNGKEADVPLDDVIRTYQKSAAADERLEEATRLLREAREREEQIRVQMEQMKAPSAAPAQPSANLADEIRNAFQSLYEGDEVKTNEAATRLAAMIEGGRAPQQPALSAEEIARQVVPFALPAIQQETARAGALAQLQRDYPDILTDPDYNALTETRIQALVQSGTSVAEAITTASEQVAAKFGLKKAGRSGGSGATAAVSVDTAKRLDRKQTIDPVPGLGVSAAPGAAGQEQTASDIIAEMRRARGQTV